MRLYAAALALEANTFSPLPTSWEAFVEKLYFPPGTHPAEPRHQTGAFWAARERAKDGSFTLVEGSCFAAQPGGPASTAAYERMRDTILTEIEAALPLDGVVLALHGAMVAFGYDDCEGDLLERVRKLVGSSCVVGVELDPHCHLTRAKCKFSDIIILFKEYPHTDFVERGEEVVTLVLDAIAGRVKPVLSLYDCRTIGNFPTTIEPMRSLVDEISALEGKDDILSISIGHGFANADVPDMGARILVVSNDAKAKGDAMAERIGQKLIGLRAGSSPPMVTIDEAIDIAAQSEGGPIVVADTTDNPGGGAAGDNTDYLRRLIERQVVGAAVAPIWDPMAVRYCFDAGLGARFALRFGGKTEVGSGMPIDAEVEVLSLTEYGFQTFAGARVPLGRTAAIRAGGVEVVLISTRAQAMGIDLFGNHGIDPSQYRLLVVKSNQHFYASFATIATRILYGDGNGSQPADVTKLPYKRVVRPIWPLDDVAEPGFVL
jgi:microcystin degradation protein MlrC